MPRHRKRRGPGRRRRGGEQLAANQRESLLTGLDYPTLGRGFGDAEGETDRETDRKTDRKTDSKRQAWERHRETLLGYWAGSTTATPSTPGARGDLGKPRPGGPGTRPWGWWQYDAPEPRRRITGQGEPAEGSPLAFGIPTRWRSIDPDDPPRYETERAYLERLDLLTPADTASPPPPADAPPPSDAPAALWDAPPGGAALDYARRVLSGALPMAKRIRQACQRHLDDLRHGHERGLTWDDTAARHLHRWFDFLTLTSAEWAGQPCQLQPWQAFGLEQIAGWRRADGFRRFRQTFWFVSRKAGKSTLVGGVGNYLFVADDEPAAQVYAAAIDKGQARIVYEEAEAFVLEQPHLAKIIDTRRDHMRHGRSRFRPLPRGAKKFHGFSPHGGLIDELHVHPDDEVLAVLKTGTGARRQPLLFIITTAGDSEESPAYEEYVHSGRVLDGVIEDDEYLPLLFEHDAPDAWKDPARWIESNPGVGISPKRDYLAAMVREAQNRPSKQADILRYQFNDWVIGSASTWLDYELWKQCHRGTGELALRELLEGEECYAGLDLAAVNDFAALALYFPARRAALVWHWTPGEGLKDRSKRDRAPLDRWSEAGWITATPGRTIDFEDVERTIKELRKRYHLVELGFDEWNALQMVGSLRRAGLACERVGRGFAGMSGPSQYLEKMVLEGIFEHGNNPVLNWQASHCEVVRDDNDSIRPRKPNKDTARRKVDGLVALVMAIARWIAASGQQKGESVYSRRAREGRWKSIVI